MAEFPVTKPQFIVPSCVNLSTYIQGMSDYEVRCYYTQLVQQWATEWAQMQTEWGSQQKAFESFKEYVNGEIAKFQSWFDNLDVQNEINNKIDEMVSDGTFLTIIQSTVNSQTQAATDAWLQKNMTPGAGAPALDSSLTLANAAAQAKAVGDKCPQVNPFTLVNENFDFNDYKTLGFYWLHWSSSITAANAPFEPSKTGTNVVLFVHSMGKKMVAQVAINTSPNASPKIATRRYDGTVWSEWEHDLSVADVDNAVKYRPQVNPFTLVNENFDFNDYKTLGFYWLHWSSSITAANAPFEPSKTGTNVVLFVHSMGKKMVAQVAINTSPNASPKIATRRYDGTVWSEWEHDLSVADVDNRVDAAVNDTALNAGVSMFDTVAVIGDSLSVGYNQNKSGTVIHPVFKQSWPQYLVKLYGTAVYWCGFSGATTKSFLDDNDTTASGSGLTPRGMTYTKNIGPKALYIIQLGVNDNQKVELGTPSDVGTNKETFYGMLSKIVENVHSLAPNAFVLVASPILNISDGFEDAIKYVGEHYEYSAFVDFRPYVSRLANLTLAGHYTELGYYKAGAAMNAACGIALSNNKFLYVNDANNNATTPDIDPYD